MRIRRAGVGVVAVVGVGLLALVCSQSAQAQVKLEKFPEGTKLTYKTTSKMQQILDDQRNGDPDHRRFDDGRFADDRQETGRFDPAG